jgi:hypothetical protein
MGYRSEWLYFDMIDGSVPMHLFHPCHIDDGWRVPGAELVIHAMAEVMVEMGESGEGLVTRTAAEFSVFAESSVIKQFFSEFKSLFRQFVVFEFVYGLGPSFGCFERDWMLLERNGGLGTY